MSLRKKLIALVILGGALGFTSHLHANQVQCDEQCLTDFNACTAAARTTCQAQCGSNQTCLGQCAGPKVTVCENTEKACMQSCI